MKPKALLLIFCLIFCSGLLFPAFSQYNYVYKWQMGAEGLGFARFRQPMGLSIDKYGNLYATNHGDHSIQKFNNKGEFLLKFGSKGSGAGQFNNPSGITVDAQGNIYVADTYNDRIQKFNNKGEFLLQFGSNGSAEGQFNWPKAVSTDGNGNLYVADYNNHRITKYTTQGEFLFAFGSLGIEEGQFNRPSGVAVDKQGNVYVGDRTNSRIQKFNSSGEFLLTFGSLGDLDGKFSTPTSIAIDGQGNLYVGDENISRIQKFDSNGKFLLKFNTLSSILSTQQYEYYYPKGITVDEQGFIYITDYDQGQVQKVDSKGVLVSNFCVRGSKEGQFNLPKSVAVDNQGNVYITDFRNQRIQKFNSNGQFLSKFGTYGTAEGQFRNPFDIDIDKNGNLYVADQVSRIQIFNSKGEFISKIGIDNLISLALDDEDNLFVSVQILTDKNEYDYQIHKFSSTGELLLKFGRRGTGEGQFGGPIKIAMDKEGNLYAADSWTRRIHKFTNNGEYITQFISTGLAEVPFFNAFDVDVDDLGNIYIADFSNSVLKLNPNGIVIAKFGTFGSGEGQFITPDGLAVDGQYNVYVIESFNDRFQKFSLYQPPTLHVKAGTSTIDDNATYSFASTTYGNAVVATFSIENTGDKAILLNNLILPDGYSMVGNFPTSITAHATASFKVQLSATTVGSYIGMLSFTTSDSGVDLYNFTLSGEVKKADQTIIFPALPTKTYTDTPFTLPASVSSALTINYTSSNPSVATVTANTITIIGAGTTLITASQSGNHNYSAALEVTQSLTVNKATQSITFPKLVDKVIGDIAFSLVATSSSGFPIKFSIDSGPASLSGDILTITDIGTVTVSAEQVGNENYESASPITQSFCVLPIKPIITNSGTLLTSSSTLLGQWYLDGEPIAGAIKQIFNAEQEGKYMVSVKGPCGGEIFSEEFTVSLSSAEELLNNSATLYPNPTSSQVIMELPKGLIWENARVVDNHGKEVAFLSGSRVESIRIFIDTLKTGFYLLEVKTAKGTIRKKFLIQ